MKGVPEVATSAVTSLPPHLEGLEAQRWARSSPSERLQSLQLLEDHIASRDGRSSHRVTADPGRGPQEYGGFVTGENGLRLNPALVGQGSTPYEAMYTVLHEGRHAHQWDAVTGKQPPPYTSRSALLSWRDNFQVYLSPTEGSANRASYEHYRFQPLESNADRFAFAWMAMEPAFAHDPGYQEFLKARDADLRKHEATATRALGADFREKIAADISERASKLRSTQETRLEQGQETQTPLQPVAQQNSASAAAGQVNVSRALMSQPVPASEAVGCAGAARPATGHRARTAVRGSSQGARGE